MRFRTPGSPPYAGKGLGGNQYDLTPNRPPALISRCSLADALRQLFGFGCPSYGASLTRNLPVKNRAAQADLGNVLVVRSGDRIAVGALPHPGCRPESLSRFWIQADGSTLTGRSPRSATFSAPVPE